MYDCVDVVRLSRAYVYMLGSLESATKTMKEGEHAVSRAIQNLLSAQLERGCRRELYVRCSEITTIMYHLCGRQETLYVFLFFFSPLFLHTELTQTH